MYHAKSLELLRSEADASDLQTVCHGEKRLRLRLPAAIREFYSNPKLTSVVDRRGGDHLFPLEKQLRGAAESLAWCEVSGETTTLVFLIENQGVFHWGAALNGSEDPAVVVKENVNGALWIPCSDQFSTYIYTRVFDIQFWSVIKGRCINCAHECYGKLSASDLDFLRSRLREEPQTFGWPCEIHRFSNGWGERLTIYDADYGATFVIAASDETSFERLKAILTPRWDFHS